MGEDNKVLIKGLIDYQHAKIICMINHK